MDERVKFIARVLDGEAMSRLCEEFSISRKIGADSVDLCGVGKGGSAPPLPRSKFSNGFKSLT
jgi:hypothetical protein